MPTPGAGPRPALCDSEDQIAVRLKEQLRPAARAVGGGSASRPAGAGAGGPGQVLDGRAVGWAMRRSLAPSSVTGISLALGLCAAAWFSAGTRAGNVSGALALCGCYLAGHAASQIAASLGKTRSRARQAARLARATWLARICSATAECAVYAGLAAGADSAGWGGPWELAVTLTVLLAVRQTMSACRSAPPGEAADGGVVHRATDAILTMPAGGRILLVAVAAPAWGPRTALLGLVVWAIAVMSYAIAGHGGGPVPPGVLAGHGQIPPGESAGHGQAHVARCRDDGAFARFLGRLLRGQLVPLPPALAGLAAASMLAVLGLRNLPGIIALTPLVVMLLAAPGASHPHDGRFDGLVPAVLQAGQYVYIAALGFAAGVPGPVVFALCAVIAIRSADLAYQAENRRPAAAGEAGAGLGWEGRMLAAGLGAIVGIAAVAYLALAAYLGALICRKALASYLAPGTGGS